MDKKKIAYYITEAKHSFAIFTSMTGQTSKANLLYLKWVDAMESLLAENETQFMSDLTTLICLPLQTVAEALNQRSTELGAGSADGEISDTIKLIIADPVEAKNNFIRICNSQIFKLKSVGMKYEYLKTSGGQQP